MIILKMGCEPYLTLFSLFPGVKTLGNNKGHAYGIGFKVEGSSGGTTDIVAMELIPL